jgi:hypothetical protein
MPVLTFTVAIAVLLLLHAPPDVGLLKADACPTQSTEAPVFAATPAFTVITLVRSQEPLEYEITAVPAPIPVTNPVVALTVAMPVDPELQVPPVVAELNTVVLPRQMLPRPVMAAGVITTVMTEVV